MARYAIADIHGCAVTFSRLLEKTGFEQEDELFLLGDYIDRGPDSKGVLDIILQLHAAGRKVYCLRGNHEAMLLNALAAPENALLSNLWLQNGGRITVESFGVTQLTAIPDRYLEFLHGLSWYWETPGYILVHAGLDFVDPNPLENQVAMLWSRAWYADINQQWLGARKIIHGHTPVPKSAIEKQLTNLESSSWLDIDAGCIYYDRPGFGQLCAFNLDTQQLTFIPFSG